MKGNIYGMKMFGIKNSRFFVLTGGDFHFGFVKGKRDVKLEMQITQIPIVTLPIYLRHKRLHCFMFIIIHQIGVDDRNTKSKKQQNGQKLFHIKSISQFCLLFNNDYHFKSSLLSDLML